MNKKLTLDSKIKDLYQHPVGRDLIHMVLSGLGKDEKLFNHFWIRNIRLSGLSKVAPAMADEAFLNTICNKLNTYEQESVAPSPPNGTQQWWKEAVAYQIYPHSFQDSNGDGIGDLKGIIEKLDYLKELGVNLLWLSPIFKSPNDDNGYDISDYRDIMNDFGTMADFDTLLKEAHQREIRLILDLVMNHTSDEHPWFLDAKKSKGNPYHDYYIWRDKNEDGTLPNNWESLFSGSAWEENPETEEYFLHLFSKKQADLNWDNQAVRMQLYDIANFWLNKGVDGFRLDVINFISKAEHLPDGNKRIGQMIGFTGAEHYFFGPHTHDYLREFYEKVLADRNALTVGETPGAGLEMSRYFTADDRHELNMVFNFSHLNCPGQERFSDYSYDLNYYKKNAILWQTQYGNNCWNSIFYDNHDNPRFLSKVLHGDETYRDEVGKLLALLQMTQKGTPFLYQGQEIGMVNHKGFQKIEDFKDVESINLYHKLKDKMPEELLLTKLRAGTRDHARTPMQWSAGKNAGFSTGIPWMTVNPDYENCNAEQALMDENSIYHFYQKLIQIRTNNKALIYGQFVPIKEKVKNVFCYERIFEGKRFYVEANLTKNYFERHTKVDDYQKIISNYQETSYQLRPYEAILYLVK